MKLTDKKAGTLSISADEEVALWRISDITFYLQGTEPALRSPLAEPLKTFRRLLRNPNAYYNVHGSSTLEPLLCHLNQFTASHPII